MPLTANKKKQIFSLGQSDPLISDREIARRLRVSRDSAAKYRGPLKSTTLTLQAVSNDDVEDSYLSPEVHASDARALERLRLDNTRLRGMNRILTRNGSMSIEGMLDRFRADLRKEEYRNFTFTPKTYPLPKKQKAIFDENHEEVATLVLSDWHCGENIRLQETNGVNAYNAMIMANRAYEIIDKFKRIVRAHQAMYTVKKLWIPLLGDMVSGAIHKDLILTNDLLDLPAVLLVSRILVMVVEELKTLGIPIEIDTVVGNHPRLLKVMPAKQQAHLSLDWLVYLYVQQAFENDPAVDVRIHLGQFGIVNQLGHRYVVEHGYGGAKDEHIPERLRRMFDSPIYREATGMQGSSVDGVIIGDKHRAEIGEGYVVNGCLTGSNEFGQSLRLSPIGAIQQAFGISRSHTRTFNYGLEATRNISETPDNPFSEYTESFLVDHGR